MLRSSLRKRQRSQRKKRECHKKENRLAEVVDKAVIMDLDAEINLCSCENDVVDETCSLGGNDTCGDCGNAFPQNPTAIST